MPGPPVVVVGGGHNGLVAACYLAKAGKAVVVLEAADKPGGGSRTDETIPGYLFNTHAAAHNIINMTRIPAELDLAGAGLDYLPMDPFATGFFRDGRAVRFHRDLEQTVASIAEGFTASITDRHIRTPTFMAQELRWPGAHPMQLDISLDQLAFMRPTRRLSGHTVPGVAGLYTCGASTAPVGGIAGSSGKAAALELLKAQP